MNTNRVRAACTLAALLLVAAASAAAPSMEIIAPEKSGAGQLVIRHPGNETTVFDNEGAVPVEIEISPALTLGPGDRIELFLDGEPVRQRNGNAFALVGIERGTHRLQARIVDAGGGTIVESDPVTFHMWQASRLFPGRQ